MNSYRRVRSGSVTSLDVVVLKGIGPKFLKLCGRVIYWQVDVEVFEESCLSTSTKALAAPVRCD
jgi:hypothetical protein